MSLPLSNIEWISASGTVISLNRLTAGVVLTDAPEGLMMPPSLITSAPVFNQPGQNLEQAQFDERVITVHMAVLGESLDDFTGIYSYLASLFNPRAGMGALRVTRDDGSARVIPCMYSKGLEGVVPIGDDSNNDVWAEVDIDFIAFDPYFLDASFSSITMRTTGVSTWFPLDLQAGLNLASSSLFGDIIIVNAGDDLAWPIWVIAGPATDPSLANLTTGAIIDLSAGAGLSLADSSELLVIDTQAGTIHKVVGDVTTNAWPALTAASDLWPFVGGDNLIHIEVGGATPASEVFLVYRLRWLTI